mmetsp:Transcript_11653/g.24997  ORF Transcript_11653/g.24997 Transcript_11653/m.24997 type:complete len:241 (-) Transcript_11653:568-1290(-)
MSYRDRGGYDRDRGYDRDDRGGRGDRGGYESRGGGQARRVSLLIRNLPMDARAEDVRAMFERYGEVRDVYLPRDYYTQRPKGFGFIEFRDARDAEEALYKLDRTVISGREISVVMSKESRKTPREMLKREDTTTRPSYRPSHRSRSPRGRGDRGYSRSRSRSRGGRGRSYSRSRSPGRRERSASRSRSRGRSASRSPSPRKDDRNDRERSASPAKDTREERDERDRSPTPRKDAERSPSN